VIFPAAVIADPPPDAKSPARMEVIHVPTGAVQINGVVYVPSGPGAHPAFVLYYASSLDSASETGPLGIETWEQRDCRALAKS